MGKKSTKHGDLSRELSDENTCTNFLCFSLGFDEFLKDKANRYTKKQIVAAHKSHFAEHPDSERKGILEFCVKKNI